MTCRRSAWTGRIADPLAAEQIDRLRAQLRRARRDAVRARQREQGIVHVIGPQLGLTQPGMTVVCGDSHTSTHGAFGALAFGIGTTEVEHVLATQTLRQVKPKAMAVTVDGDLAPSARPRTWCSASSGRWASAAAPARSSSTAATRSARCRWKAG